MVGGRKSVIDIYRPIFEKIDFFFTALARYQYDTEPHYHLVQVLGSKREFKTASLMILSNHLATTFKTLMCDISLSVVVWSARLLEAYAACLVMNCSAGMICLGCLWSAIHTAKSRRSERPELSATRSRRCTNCATPIFLSVYFGVASAFLLWLIIIPHVHTQSFCVISIATPLEPLRIAACETSNDVRQLPLLQVFMKG